MSKAEDILKAKETVEATQVVKRDEVALSQFKEISTFDWKKVPPPQLAVVISKIPFKASEGQPDYFLAPWQCMLWAMRCFELGLSPFSNETWFNPKNNKVNLTLEGKLARARSQGKQIGAPKFERNPQDKQQPLVSYISRIPYWINGERQEMEYEAFLAEWQVSTSPVWKLKQEHMLKLRSFEKGLSWIIGEGASELPDDRDIEPPQLKQIPQTIDVPEMDFVPAVFDSNNEKENK